MAVAGIAVVFAAGLPQWDATSANISKASSLKDELKSSETQQESLKLQISMLEKNIDIPSDIEIKTFNDNNEEQATKELLDHVVNLATTGGNKFISLSPAEVAPFWTPPPPPKTQDPNAPAAPTDAAASAAPAASATDTPAATDPNAAAAAASSAASLLVTKGYDLTIRGTYTSLQSFLRAMDKQRMIFDMSNFDLESESSSTTADAGSTVSDPDFPLRLKVTLRLALQHLEPSTGIK